MRAQIQTESIQYVERTFAPEDQHLDRIRKALRGDEKEGINVGATEGRLLQVLLRMVGARRVVEVGTLYGYSTLWMARALPADGKLISLEASAEHAARARALLSETDQYSKIEIVEGPAEKTIQSLEGPVDVAFIDANKAAYETYLDWAEANVRKGGLIIGDNTFLWGKVYENQESPDAATIAMRRFNERLANPERYESILIPTSEGMTVALKKF